MCLQLGPGRRRGAADGPGLSGLAGGSQGPASSARSAARRRLSAEDRWDTGKRRVAGIWGEREGGPAKLGKGGPPPAAPPRDSPAGWGRAELGVLRRERRWE